MNKYYIYMHTKIGDTLPFYVGKGKGNRAYDKFKRSNYWKNVAKDGYTIKLFENLSEHHAFELEIAFIKLYGRRDLGTGCLVNLTDGGEGTSGWQKKNISDEYRKKLSDAQKGKTYSDESKIKMSKAKLGKTPWKGKMHSDKTKQKMSEAKKGKINSDEHKRKISEASKAYWANKKLLKENIAL